jgi:hypothetical protein
VTSFRYPRIWAWAGVSEREPSHEAVDGCACEGPAVKAVGLLGACHWGPQHRYPRGRGAAPV